jgi:hypothetical protein
MEQVGVGTTLESMFSEQDFAVVVFADAAATVADTCDVNGR